MTFNGFNTHPGYAKGKMVNAIRVAADFIASLPRESLSPETTAGYDGFVHAYDVSASVASDGRQGVAARLCHRKTGGATGIDRRSCTGRGSAASGLHGGDLRARAIPQHA